jgi:RNA polymerase sigma-70 factor (ECF subfamily)
MGEGDGMAERFEENRARLRAVSYRMLGSLSEAEDAVQEAWLRFSRSDTSRVGNVEGWLTTIVARVCLDTLRSRKSRREDPFDIAAPELSGGGAIDPEEEAVLAESVGLALLVVLETLAPAERLAFVLHDLFGVPFDEIGSIVGRSPTAARQMASRARRRVRGGSMVRDASLARQREVVDAFLAASRGGDLKALLAVLDPDVVLRVDQAAHPGGDTREFRGSRVVAGRAAAGYAPGAELALINGTVGVVVAPRGRLRLVLAFRVTSRRIVEMEVIADPDRLRRLDVAVLED